MKKFIVIMLLLSVNIFAKNSYSTSSNWLIEKQTNQEKFEAIQKQFRGFDLAMVEVGYRFNSFYFAIEDKNYDLANYQWDKINKAIKNGIIRRPAREANSKSFFIETQYKSMKEALNKKDKKLIKSEYEKTKLVCNACHKAERVPFIKVIDPKTRWQPIK